MLDGWRGPCFDLVVRARSWSPLLVLAPTALVLASLVASGCYQGAFSTTCTNVPDGGCPLSYGQSCADPACAAIYACLSGNRWELRGTCPPREGGTVLDAGPMPDASPPRDASIDVEGAFGGPGCTSLQLPDCSLGTAVLCPSGCCGCEDLFVCRNGGWNLWGACGPDGAVPN